MQNECRLRLRSRSGTGPARALALVLASVCATLAGTAPARAQSASLAMASKNFAGAEVLSQAYGQALAAGGGHITFSEDVGATEVVFPGLQAGTYDAYADYQGTLLTYLGGEPSANSTKTHTALLERLQGTGITVSDPAPAVDVNGFYVTRKTAARLRLRTVSDLRKVAPRLRIGAPPECTSRPLCLGEKSQQTYGLRFRTFVPFDPETRAAAQALSRGEIDVAVLFTGSSVIHRNAVLLRDDKGLQPAENPVLVMRDPVATPEVLRVVDAVSAEITTTVYNGMSLAVSLDARDPTEVAARFLAEHSLP